MSAREFIERVEALAGAATEGPWEGEVDAWWALREDVIFTLTRGMAEDVAEAVSAR